MKRAGQPDFATKEELISFCNNEISQIITQANSRFYEANNPLNGPNQHIRQVLMLILNNIRKALMDSFEIYQMITEQEFKELVSGYDKRLSNGIRVNGCKLSMYAFE